MFPITMNLEDLDTDQKERMNLVYKAKNKVRAFEEVFGVIECVGDYQIHFDKTSFKDVDGEMIIDSGFIIFTFDKEQYDVTIRFAKFRHVNTEFRGKRLYKKSENDPLVSFPA